MQGRTFRSLAVVEVRPSMISSRISFMPKVLRGSKVSLENATAREPSGREGPSNRLHYCKNSPKEICNSLPTTLITGIMLDRNQRDLTAEKPRAVRSILFVGTMRAKTGVQRQRGAIHIDRKICNGLHIHLLSNYVLAFCIWRSRPRASRFPETAPWRRAQLGWMPIRIAKDGQRCTEAVQNPCAHAAQRSGH